MLAGGCPGNQPVILALCIAGGAREYTSSGVLCSIFLVPFVWHENLGYLDPSFSVVSCEGQLVTKAPCQSSFPTASTQLTCCPVLHLLCESLCLALPMSGHCVTWGSHSPNPSLLTATALRSVRQLPSPGWLLRPAELCLGHRRCRDTHVWNQVYFSCVLQVSLGSNFLSW